MRLNFDIKPTIIEGWGTTYHARWRLMDVIGVDPKYVYGYNIEVFKRGKHRKHKHYKIYLYKFPIEIVEAMNLSIKQGTRTFKVKTIKG